MAACVFLVVQPPILAGRDYPGWTLLPQQQTQIAQVTSSSDAEDWEETYYLESIPGVGASIRRGLATPVSELVTLELVTLPDLMQLPNII